jgi:hypothetical protein
MLYSCTLCGLPPSPNTTFTYHHRHMLHGATLPSDDRQMIVRSSVRWSSDYRQIDRQKIHATYRGLPRVYDMFNVIVLHIVR